MKRIIVSFFLISILISCSDSEDENENSITSKIDINLVTGIDVRPDEFSSVIRLGNPNTFEDQTLVFPNPPIDFLSIKTFNGSDISSVWVIDGLQEKIYKNLNFDSVLNSELYAIHEIENAASLEFSDNQSSNLLINLENLEDGYYRVFIEVNGTIEWHNIYKGEVDIQNFIDSWN